MVLTLVSLTDKVGIASPKLALGVQSLYSRLLAILDPNTWSFLRHDSSLERKDKGL